jgi:hypothetical protein
MKHLLWSAAGLCIVTLAACDSTPADPGTTNVNPVGVMAVAVPVLGVVPVLNEDDGHLYDAVAVGAGINWTSARARAEALSSGSCQGYLASITSPEENAFILNNFSDLAPFIGNGHWIGGYQPADPPAPSAAEGWLWVSGDPFVFSDWADGQPDDGGGVLVEEDAIHFVSGGIGGAVKWNDLRQTENTTGYVVEFDGVCSDEALIEVMLKLKQGEGARNINLKSRGKIAAAVLSMADSGAGDGFDATTIDPTTVTLGDGSDPDAPVAGNKHGKLMVAWPDLNDDGLKDALFHFNTQDLVAAGLTEETTELVLHGMTTEAVEFSGADEVAVK